MRTALRFGLVLAGVGWFLQPAFAFKHLCCTKTVGIPVVPVQTVRTHALTVGYLTPHALTVSPSGAEPSALWDQLLMNFLLQRFGGSGGTGGTGGTGSSEIPSRLSEIRQELKSINEKLDKLAAGG